MLPTESEPTFNGVREINGTGRVMSINESHINVKINSFRQPEQCSICSMQFLATAGRLMNENPFRNTLACPMFHSHLPEQLKNISQ